MPEINPPKCSLPSLRLRRSIEFACCAADARHPVTGRASSPPSEELRQSVHLLIKAVEANGSRERGITEEGVGHTVLILTTGTRTGEMESVRCSLQAGANPVGFCATVPASQGSGPFCGLVRVGWLARRKLLGRLRTGSGRENSGTGQLSLNHRAIASKSK
jgi:hypothetical protein